MVRNKHYSVLLINPHLLVAQLILLHTELGERSRFTGNKTTAGAGGSAAFSLTLPRLSV